MTTYKNDSCNDKFKTLRIIRNILFAVFLVVITGLAIYMISGYQNPTMEVILYYATSVAGMIGICIITALFIASFILLRKGEPKTSDIPISSEIPEKIEETTVPAIEETILNEVAVIDSKLDVQDAAIREEKAKIKPIDSFEELLEEQEKKLDLVSEKAPEIMQDVDFENESVAPEETLAVKAVEATEKAASEEPKKNIDDFLDILENIADTDDVLPEDEYMGKHAASKDTEKRSASEASEEENELKAQDFTNSLEKMKAEYEEKLRNKDSVINELKEELEKGISALENSTQKAQTSEEEKEKLLSKIRSLEAESNNSSALNEEIDSLTKRVKSLTQKVDTLNIQNKELSRFREKNKDLEYVQTENAKLKAENQKMSEIRNEADRLKTEFEESSQTIDSLKKEKKDLKKTVSDLEKQLKEAAGSKTAMNELESRIKDMDKSVSNLKRENQSLKDRNENYQTQAKESSFKIEKLEKEKKKLEQSVENIKSEKKGFVSELEKARSDLEEARFSEEKYKVSCERIDSELEMVKDTMNKSREQYDDLYSRYIKTLESLVKGNKIREEVLEREKAAFAQI